MGWPVDAFDPARWRPWAATSLVLAALKEFICGDDAAEGILGVARDC